ncbi:MAG: hypothetical protein JO207_08515 [Verrucomicrobia bacterium]|nr:hypothetical protein [Verrucomicrobiota bacterium]
MKKARAVAADGGTELHVGYSPTPTARLLTLILRAYQHAMPKVRTAVNNALNGTLVALDEARIRRTLFLPLEVTGELYEVANRFMRCYGGNRRQLRLQLGPGPSSPQKTGVGEQRSSSGTRSIIALMESSRIWKVSCLKDL